MGTVFIVAKLLVIIAQTLCVIIASIFYIGSVEQFAELKAGAYWKFVFMRFVMDMLVGLFFFGVSMLLNLLFKRYHGISPQSISTAVKLELIYLVLLSVIMTLVVWVFLK